MTALPSDTLVVLPAPSDTDLVSTRGRLLTTAPRIGSSGLNRAARVASLAVPAPSTMLPAGAHKVPFWVMLAASSSRLPPADRGTVGVPDEGSMSMVRSLPAEPATMTKLLSLAGYS